MQIAAPIFLPHKQFDMHYWTMGFPIISTITPLYLSKFTDFWAAMQHIFFFNLLAILHLGRNKKTGWLLCFGEYCNWILFNCNSICSWHVMILHTPPPWITIPMPHAAPPCGSRTEQSKKAGQLTTPVVSFGFLLAQIFNCNLRCPDMRCSATPLLHKLQTPRHSPHPPVAETEQSKKEVGQLTTPVVSFVFFIGSNI